MNNVFCRLDPVPLSNSEVPGVLRRVLFLVPRATPRGLDTHECTQSVILPESDALALVAAFGEPGYQLSVLEPSIADLGWIHGRALSAVVSLIQRLCAFSDRGLGAHRKYLTLRIDTRDLSFQIKGVDDGSLSHQFVPLVRERLRVF